MLLKYFNCTLIILSLDAGLFRAFLLRSVSFHMKEATMLSKLKSVGVLYIVLYLYSNWILLFLFPFLLLKEKLNYPLVPNQYFY